MCIRDRSRVKTVVLITLVVLTPPLIDEVDDEGDEPGVGVARVPFGLVLKSIPTKRKSQLPHDNLHMTIVGVEGLSTSGVYELFLDSSRGHPFLNRGCRYLLVLCCTGFD